MERESLPGSRPVIIEMLKKEKCPRYNKNYTFEELKSLYARFIFYKKSRF